jgi:DNA repair exonuclease SbcCD ATPase subunit
MTRNLFAPLLAVGLLLTVQACSRESDSASTEGASAKGESDVTLQDVKQSFNRLTEEIAAYSFDQRDKALNTARKELDAIDAQIEALQKSAEIRSQQLSSDLRKKQSKLLEELQERRAQASDMTKRLSQSSAGAWDEMRDGLTNAYDDLEQALEKARAEFAATDGNNDKDAGS